MRKRRDCLRGTLRGGRSFRQAIRDCLRGRITMMDIEITSWKARAYGIFTRVGEVSEIERVSAANE